MKRALFRFLVSSFIFPAMLSAAAETLVGSLPGDVNVDNTGEATFSMPISLPPGTAGVAPTLGIGYSSKGGSGILGLGFSLNGLSSISRAPATRLHDGVIDGVDFDGLDRLLLDGQRLILVSDGAYGAVDSEYRTEIDSFAKITLKGAGHNAPGAWFEVRTKSGLIYEYGNTTDSFVEPEGRTEALRWVVNKVRDTAGNTMTFHYSENANEPHLLQRIEYTGNSAQGLSPYNTVTFIYEDRDDVRIAWIFGSKMVGNKRLQKIEISGPEGALSDYRFEYAYSEAGMSLLQSVQQFFVNGDSIPKTVFEYTATESNKPYTGMFHGINGTNFIPEGAENNVFRDKTPKEISAGDFNGDGLLDLMRLDYSNDPKYSWIAWGSRAGTFTYESGTNFISEESAENVYRSEKMQTLLPDFNGDGISDVICIAPKDTPGKSWIRLSDESGSTTYLTGTNFIPNGALGDVFRDSSSSVMSGDFNGDGLADLFSVYPGDDGAESQKCWIGLTTTNENQRFDFYNGTNFIPRSANGGVYRGIYTTVQTGDFNGDGLTDLLSIYPDNDPEHSWMGLSNGDGTFSYRNGTNFIGQGSADNVYRDLTGRIFTADFNGDGLTDVVRMDDSNLSKYSWLGLSKGDGTFEYKNGTEFIPDGVPRSVYRTQKSSTFAADMNGDGLSDLVSIRPHNNSAYSWVGFSNGDGTFRYVSGTDFILNGIDNHLYRDSETAVSVGDFNGDGMVDFLSVYPDNEASKSWVALNTHEQCFLKKVTKGVRSETEHGSVSEIEYLPITDSSIYSKGSGAEYPVYDVKAPMYVVSALSKDNGVGGKYWSDFTYANARTHRDRGFLGFQIFESYDRQTKLSQVEVLAQDFPHTGSSLRQETYYFPDIENDPTDGQLLKEVSNTYLYDKVDHGGTSTNHSLFAYVAKSVEKAWELNQTNSPMTEVTSYNWFDNQPLGEIPMLVQTNAAGQDLTYGYITYGEITKIVMDYGDGSKQISSNTYYMDGRDDWLLGRLATASVTHRVGADSTNRTSSFQYNGTSGLLEREVVGPGTDLEVATEYAYDGYGNITNKTLYPANMAPRTVQSSVYDPKGRFVIESQNTLGHSETYDYYQNTGLLKSQTGPNGLTTTWQYDPLGRKTLETRADGTTTSTQYAWLQRKTTSVPDPFNSGNTLLFNASYAITEQSSGSAPITVWYDNQGRELRKIVLSPNGREVWQDTGYNAFGQDFLATAGYFPGEDIKYTFSECDELGRVQYVTSPDGTVGETVYNGLTTQTIIDSNHRTTDLAENPPRHQITTTIKNAKGQVLEVIDTLNNSLTYEYDPVGNLTATVAAGIRTEMRYDALGKKVWQSDPDMGIWTYDYNALGELTSQTDANGNRIETAYDDLGRISSRTNWVMKATTGLELESTAAWFYDGTDEGCWIGAPRREELRDQNGDLVWRKTHAYDSLGRPMLELYNFDNKWYYTCFRYDELGRLKFTDRFWRPKDKQGDEYTMDPEWNVFTTANTFNQYGVITKVSDSTGHDWWQIDEEDFDSQGRLLEFTLGNDTVTAKTYDENTGRLTAITTRNASSSSTDIQNDQYNFDRLGNIKYRRDLHTGISLWEDFDYDNLNRLTSAQVQGQDAQSCSYDAHGNILSKTGVGNYTYGQNGAGVHAVTSVSGGDLAPVTSYTYDNNGNMTGRTVGTNSTVTARWTSFNKPSSLFNDFQNGSTFTYDINNNRITQISRTASSAKKKIYIAGMEQEETASNPAEMLEANLEWEHKKTRIFISTPSGLVGVHVQTPGATSQSPNSIERKYFHTDHLGSIVAVTGEKTGDAASELARYSYDAWGRQRNAGDWAKFSQSEIGNQNSEMSANRGFTGHEMLDNLGLVHMNGRIYDATLGRFLSADPQVQYPGDLQNYNRYTYVNNNPLRFVDPSGYGFFSSIGKFFSKIGNFFKKYWKVIVVVAIAVVCAIVAPYLLGLEGFWAGVVGGFAGGFAGGFSGTLLNGGSLLQAFRAGLEGAAWGAVAGAAGGYINGLKFGLESIKWINTCRALAHGLTGGVISYAQGSSLESGFLSGFAGGMAAGNFKSLGGKMFAGAIVGGCASVIGGGKFENGAVTGAFTALTYAVMSDPAVRQRIWEGVRAVPRFISRAIGRVNVLGNAADNMRDLMVAQSRLDPLGRNESGVSVGFRGDGFKLGGGRFNPRSGTPSPLGGVQGGQGEVFGMRYQPGSFADHLIEAFAGPHDYLNSGYTYDQVGNIRPKSFVGNVVGQVLNYGNVAVASPFVVGSVVLPTNDNPWF